MFCLPGKVFECVLSYLEKHSQRVCVHGNLSYILSLLLSRVAQGVVLGALVFTIYTHNLEFIAHCYGITCHVYADDIHLFISLSPGNELNFFI